MNVTYLVSLLPLLVCPLAMGLVMWLMMRGHQGQAGEALVNPMDATVSPLVATPDSPDRLSVLRAQLEQVEARQAALAAHLTRLGAPEQPAESLADARESASALAG